MTASNLEQIFQAAAAAPTEEVIVEEVVTREDDSLDNLVYYTVELASCMYHLNMQACLIALNLEHPNFCSLQPFLKEQADCHMKDFECLAETVRSMDYLLPMCQKGLLGYNKSFKTTKSYDAVQALQLYVKNLEDAGYKAKECHDKAKAVGAPDLENIIADVIHHMFTGAWKLKSSMR